jgi:hypothetical protein
MSVVFFALALVYSWLFSTIGIETSLHRSLEVRYDETCRGQAFCLVPFEVSDNFSNDVGLYYRLTQVGQMRREVATSFQPDMLRGLPVSPEQLKSCAPEIYINNTKDDNNLLMPCGLLARSAFNDSFTPLAPLPEFSDADIALNIDKTDLYHPPHADYNHSSEWLADSGLFPGGQTNPHFIVWMRQSPYMPFRKLYAMTHNGLRAGNYTMLVRNIYDTGTPKSEKAFVFAEVGRLGTSKWGVAIIFGVMVALFFVASATLGLIGWRRQRPSSPFHPNQLKNILTGSEK